MAAIGAPAAAGITAAADLSIAGMQYDSQRSTDEMNYKIAQERNATELANWYAQRKHDLEMWEKENQYNTPQAQMQRMLDAGLNPTALVDNGNATSFAGGQTPPDLAVPEFHNPLDGAAADSLSRAFDIQSMASAFKQFQEGKNIQNQSIISGFQVDAYRESALKGDNPELYKIGAMLETYNKLKKENKWIDPVTEANLKKVGTETDLNKAFYDVRKQECERLKHETEGIKLTNKFNAEQFPEQLKLLGEQIKSEIQNRHNQTNLTQAQINQANESAELLGAQKNLVDEDIYVKQFENGLRKFGVNPNSKTLPFFAGIALQLSTGKISPAEVSEYFKNLAYADRIGWDKVAKSNANLTKFELQGSKDGMFGTGINIRDMLQQLSGMLLPSPDNHPTQIK